MSTKAALVLCGLSVLGNVGQSMDEGPSLAESLREFLEPCRGVAGDRSTWGPMGDPASCRYGWSRSAQELGSYANKNPARLKRVLAPLLAGVKQVRVNQRRQAAIQGLIAMDPPPPEAILVLLQATRSSNNEVVRLAVSLSRSTGRTLFPFFGRPISEMG